MALNPLRRSFLNFAKSCILSCLLQFENKNRDHRARFLSYKRFKIKLRMSSAGHIVIVIFCLTTELSGIWVGLLVTSSKDKAQNTQETFDWVLSAVKTSLGYLCFIFYQK